MIILKTYHITTIAREYEILIKEHLDSSEYSLFTWPSSLLLAAFLASDATIVRGKRVVELGAGTALPSLLCGKLGASQVLITEREDQPEMLHMIQEGIQLNGLDKCEVKGITWGMKSLTSDVSYYEAESVDVVLGADVFYSSEDFDRLLLTVFRYMVLNNQCVFYTTYQERR